MEVRSSQNPGDDQPNFIDAFGLSTDDNEFADKPNLATNGDRIWIRVFGNAVDGNQGNGYTLTWAYQAVGDPDVYEPNDSISAAVALSAATPANVTATAGDTEVVLSWDAIAEAEGYTVYWNTTGNVTSSDNSIDAGANTQITHSGLSNGTTYYYRVVANKANEMIFAVLGLTEGAAEDWYSIYVQPDTDTVTALHKHKTTGSNAADIKMTLFDKDGNQVGSTSTSDGDNENLAVNSAQGLTEGVYNVQVKFATAPGVGNANDLRGYSLTWDATSASPIVPSGSSALSLEVSAAPAAAVTPTAPASSGGGGALSPLSMVVMLVLSLVSLTRRFSHSRSSN